MNRLSKFNLGEGKKKKGKKKKAAPPGGKTSQLTRKDFEPEKIPRHNSLIIFTGATPE